MAVPINATCAIAANEQEMLMFLEKANEAGYLIGSPEGRVVSAKTGKDKPEIFGDDLYIIFDMVKRGNTYVLLFKITNSSHALHSTLQHLASLMPAGTWGIAYSFAWDFEPGMVALNSDDKAYAGGGAETPFHLWDLDYDYEPYSDWRNWLRRKGQKVPDIEACEDVQHVAETEAMRWWSR